MAATWSSVVTSLSCRLKVWRRLTVDPLYTKHALNALAHRHTHTRTHARTHARTHTHTHLFNGPLSGTTRVSWHQKGKTNLDFTETRDSEWQWHQLGHMQVQDAPHSRQITMPAPHRSVFTGRMPFLPPNQQRQSTEGNALAIRNKLYSADVRPTQP